MISTKVLFSDSMRDMPPTGIRALPAWASKLKAEALPTP